ncbi:unnamed protein product [Adineta steineri]|uniref:Uncharacterized protein n=1 Tax=Adineta steineri TaxID=433720 RepID=A0A819QG85_9BILA|nr:unnamed protein product [Adineta steineri]CAF4031204.1 unnamed protein product [Adineta steineri]
MVKVWYQHDQNVPAKINIDPDSDIDDLKEKIFGSTDKGQYQTTYNGQLLRPSAGVPQDTTDEMPIVFTKIVNVPSSKFAAPGTCEELRCRGRPCAKCHKCRDWHFTGDQEQWNWICNQNTWKEEDMQRWRNDGYVGLFKKRDGATCNYYNVVTAYAPAPVKTAYNRGIARSDLVYGFAPLPPPAPDLGHVCLCEKY